MAQKTISKTTQIKADTARRAKVPEGVHHLIFRDTILKGFQLRVFKSGGKYSFTGRIKGTDTRRTITIGDAVALTASQARTEAERLRVQFALGEDPVAAAEAARAAQVTFGDLTDRYLAKFETGGLRRQKRAPRPTSIKSEKKDANRALDLLGRETIAADIDARRLNRLIDDMSPYAASVRKKTFGVVQRVLGHGVTTGLLDMNIALAVETPIGSESRERYLTPDELAKVWKAAGQMGAYGRLVRFLVAMPVRATVARMLTADQIDGATLIVADAVEGNKAATRWELPLNDLALAQIGDDDLVFRGRNGGPVAVTSTAKDRLDELSGVTGWVLHDLRRTYSTLLADAVDDLDVDAAEQWMMHKRKGVAGIYNRSQRKTAMRHVATLWGAELARIVGEDSPVIPVTFRA
ncbi:integrase arm-type DNA-binding domain-containing protein [Primorskyibacter sp. S87]|uniref:integrase arm-type DNA-binding domain-containing protein n=1 Tax=Primorskyibacter sp. S87 TaxID=3415126 RepID=UPI003C7CE515